MVDFKSFSRYVKVLKICSILFIRKFKIIASKKGLQYSTYESKILLLVNVHVVHHSFIMYNSVLNSMRVQYFTWNDAKVNEHDRK